MSHDYEKVDQDTEREIDKSVMKELKRENAELARRVVELEYGLVKIANKDGEVNYSQSDVEYSLDDAISIAKELLK